MQSVPQQENTLWTGSPSQASNIGSFIFCGLTFFLVLPLIVAWWKWFSTKKISYELKSERFRVRSGVLNKAIDDLELYRVVDYRIEQPLLLRFFRKSNVILVTSDSSHPRFVIDAIDDAENLIDLLRSRVEECKSKRMVREITIN